MTAKIRKQLTIEPAQQARLKRLAEATGQSEAGIVRRALDQYVNGVSTPMPDRSAWQAILSFIEARAALSPVESKRTWTREELHDRSEPVCGSQ